MFVVVQEVKVKKSDKGGYPKELKSEWLPMVLNGEDIGHYWHFYSDEKFERPVKKAYRISLHHSFRKNGKVQKKQFVLCTVNYYDLARASVTFCQGQYKSRIKKLAADCPEECQIMAENTDGSLCAYIPVAWIKINPTYQLTEKQREQRAETMRRNLRK